MPSNPTPDGVLLLDKPAGVTSTRALAAAKRALGAAKGGHTGTLDPFATGLLPLVFGEATKFSRFLIDSTKAYEATLSLGEETPTGDPESPVTRNIGVIPDSTRIDEVLAFFAGVQHQIPPMHSALHVGGRRLYEYARQGIEVAREPRTIEIFQVKRLRLDGSKLVVSVLCSKGTYVRVLAADIGRVLGCGAYLTALRRTQVGPFTVQAAVGSAELEARGEAWGRARLLPVPALVSDLDRLEASSEQAARFRHGRLIEAEGFSASQPVAIFAPDGEFLGVAEARGDGWLAPSRLMAEQGEIA